MHGRTPPRTKVIRQVVIRVAGEQNKYPDAIWLEFDGTPFPAQNWQDSVEGVPIGWLSEGLSALLQTGHGVLNFMWDVPEVHLNRKGKSPYVDVQLKPYRWAPQTTGDRFRVELTQLAHAILKIAKECIRLLDAMEHTEIAFRSAYMKAKQEWLNSKMP